MSTRSKLSLEFKRYSIEEKECSFINYENDDGIITPNNELILIEGTESFYDFEKYCILYDIKVILRFWDPLPVPINKYNIPIYDYPLHTLENYFEYIKCANITR